MKKGNDVGACLLAACPPMLRAEDSGVLFRFHFSRPSRSKRCLCFSFGSLARLAKEQSAVLASGLIILRLYVHKILLGRHCNKHCARASFVSLVSSRIRISDSDRTLYT